MNISFEGKYTNTNSENISFVRPKIIESAIWDAATISACYKIQQRFFTEKYPSKFCLNMYNSCEHLEFNSILRIIFPFPFLFFSRSNFSFVILSKEIGGFEYSVVPGFNHHISN